MFCAIQVLSDNSKKSEDSILVDAKQGGNHVQGEIGSRTLERCPPSYSQTPLVLDAEKAWCEKQSTTRHKFSLYNGLVIIEDKLDLLDQRIKECPSMGWHSLDCGDCGKVVKAKAIRKSCLSPYCFDPECLKNKERIAKAELRKKFPTGKRLIHFIIGFPRVPSYSSTVKEHHAGVINGFVKVMRKTFPKFAFIKVRDITGGPGDLFVHYHCALLINVNHARFLTAVVEAREEVMKKLDCSFTVRSKHYKSSGAVFGYFAKRLSGQYGDIKAGKSYGYEALMSLEEYFKDVFNTRALSILYNRKGESPSVMFHRLRSDFSDKPFHSDFPTICPYCGSSNLKLRPPDH